MSYTSIEDIPIPADLTEIQRAEYIAYQKSMAQLEKEWAQLQSDENADQRACVAIIQETFERKKNKISEKLATRKRIVQKQLQKEISKIEKEYEESEETLKNRLIRAYCQSDQNITSQLRDLKGKDGVENLIEFPQISPDTQMMTRTKQPEELKFRLSTQDCEKDFRQIQNIFERE